MNYYADGEIGGNLRLEIDETALLVWSFVSHAGWLDGSARTAYLARMWPTVKAAADFLAGWKDPANGLVWPANEDDNNPFTQGLQGAITVFGAPGLTMPSSPGSVPGVVGFVFSLPPKAWAEPARGTSYDMW